ncbi:MAG: hypothetical protein U1E60_29085 [Reyranellaceae bacterium]
MLFRLLVLVVGLLGSMPGPAGAQTEAVAPFAVSVPQGAALLEAAGSLWEPVWRHAGTIAFQREAIDPSGVHRQWIEYHSLTVRIRGALD